MGQTKSKSCLPSGWRRLSESDCIHLLNDDELNNHHNPYVPNNQELFHQIYYPDSKYSSNKWSAAINSNNNTIGKCNNLGELDLSFRPKPLRISLRRVCSKHQQQQQQQQQPNQYNKNLFEASKNGGGGGGTMVRKSLPPCPAGKQQTPLLGPPSTTTTTSTTTMPRHARFAAFPALLEPEMLLMRSSSLKHSRRSIEEEESIEEMDDSRMVAESFRQSDLIESPPPLMPDMMMTNPFNSSSMKPQNSSSSSAMRPITMYQFEQFASSKSSGTLPSGLTFSHHPAASSVARGLSLSDLLEQCNVLEDEEEEQFSDQTLVDTNGTMGPPMDSEEQGEAKEKNKAMNSTTSNNNCILVDIGQSAENNISNNNNNNNNSQLQATLRDQQHLQTLSRNAAMASGQVGAKGTTGSPIRCSGLDCICDRCIGHRFKLLNWLLPNCTRINAERLLHGRMEGTFLVRKSEKFPGQYTLSFVCRRTVRHCLIMRSVYGFGLRWPYSFETLQQVIIHYARTTLAEFNSKLDVRLRYPVFMA
ncbi:Phosphatidylinositol 3-kinase regulatory subunit gamma [Tyrophagus putrescentiae]|nr:Phosphatidylinositol 3-kinase regulatory subunit gamma [Tyrophagus putrescentiae]